MQHTRNPNRSYTKAERFTDACVHFTGMALALMGVPVLITLAIFWQGHAVTVTGVVIYGVSLILMIHCSALYHMVRIPSLRSVFRRLDHMAIYVKIAGTYTPFALIGGANGYLLAGIWSAAAFGTALKIWDPAGYRWVTLALYVGMGWIGAIAGGAMMDALSGTGFALILIGGLIYTVGVFFFLWELLPHHNTIWHIFVLVGSILLYAAVLVELAPKSSIG